MPTPRSIPEPNLQDLFRNALKLVRANCKPSYTASTLAKPGGIRMAHKSRPSPVSRRRFLAATSGAFAAAPVAARGASNASAAGVVIPAPSSPLKKIPIGVFDPVFSHLSLDELLDKLTEIGLEAVEIASAGSHCPLQDILDDPGKA